MKTLLIILTVIFTVIVVFQFVTLITIKKTEKQKYTVVHRDKGFEIRFYPSAILATIRSDAKTYKELSNPGFRKLAGYIFGGNEAGAKISMTAPVQMDINDSSSTMSFVMPATYQTENLPKPKDPG
jgi:hypothetical protein